METAHEARVPFVEIGPGLRGTALATQVPFADTAPCEYATDGVGARQLKTGAICAALLDRLAVGGRASRETEVSLTVLPAGGSRVTYRRRPVNIRCGRYLVDARSGFRSGCGQPLSTFRERPRAVANVDVDASAAEGVSA